MRGRSYSYSPSPPRYHSRRNRSPSPRGRYGGHARDLPTSLLVRNLRLDCRSVPIRYLLQIAISVKTFLHTFYKYLLINLINKFRFYLLFIEHQSFHKLTVRRPEDLRVPFGEFGPLKDVYLPRDYYTG